MALASGGLRHLLFLGFGLSWAACGGNAQQGRGGGESGAEASSGMGGSQPSAGRAASAGSVATAGYSGEAFSDAGAAGALAGAGGAPPEAAGAGGEADGLPCSYFEGDGWSGEGCFAACGDQSVDFFNDWTNCGGCGIQCHVGSQRCDRGSCIPEPCPTGSASCTEPGCAVKLDLPDNCGACGVVATSPLAHTVALCGCAGECEVGACAPGHANCDRASNDCESLATGGTCGPTPLASWCVRGEILGASRLALATDGTLFISGLSYIDYDFDPSPAVDVHASGAYLSKFNPDGSYAWTKTWSSPTGPFWIRGLHAGSDGSIAVFGEAEPDVRTSKVQLDLDPGPEVDLRTQGAILLELDATGSYVWGRTWGGSTAIIDAALDSSGRAYVVGQFVGRMDADPGPEPQLLGIGGNNGGDFLLSLDAAGGFRWARSTSSARCSSGLTSVDVSGETLWAGGWLQGCAGQTSSEIELAPNGDPSGRQPLTPFFLRTTLDGTVERAFTLSNDDSVSVAGLAIGSGGSVYVGLRLSGHVDFDPGPGSAARSAYMGSAVLSLSNEGAYRWDRTGGNSVGEGVSLAPNDGILASPWAGNPTAWDSSGDPVFTLNSARYITSSATGIVLIAQNEAHCPGGYEVQRFTW